MNDHLQTYSRAVFNYTEAVQKARRVSEIINRGASALRNWEQVRVTDTEGVFPEFLSRTTTSDSHVQGLEWPSAQQIADALLDYHRTKHELELAFTGIPDDQRQALRSPDSIVPPR
jgi:hypothetical protein